MTVADIEAQITKKRLAALITQAAKADNDAFAAKLAGQPDEGAVQRAAAVRAELYRLCGLSAAPAAPDSAPPEATEQATLAQQDPAALAELAVATRTRAEEAEAQVRSLMAERQVLATQVEDLRAQAAEQATQSATALREALAGQAPQAALAKAARAGFAQGQAETLSLLAEDLGHPKGADVSPELDEVRGWIAALRQAAPAAPDGPADALPEIPGPWLDGEAAALAELALTRRAQALGQEHKGAGKRRHGGLDGRRRLLRALGDQAQSAPEAVQIRLHAAYREAYREA